jgi:hypothetical protein
MAVALVFAMKLRDSSIYLNDDLEEFMVNVQPPVTEENYSEILRCSERNSTESAQSNDDGENRISQYRKNRLVRVLYLFFVLFNPEFSRRRSFMTNIVYI